jgi:hypothetical protein
MDPDLNSEFRIRIQEANYLRIHNTAHEMDTFFAGRYITLLNSRGPFLPFLDPQKTTVYCLLEKAKTLC